MVPGRVAYGISKLGMTLLTLGLAEEVRPHNIAVNSLWPVTIIESQASINHSLGTPAMWRKPDILVDCVLRLVQKEPAEVTGQALLDEDFLRAEGVTDFSGYACVPEPSRSGSPGLRCRLSEFVLLMMHQEAFVTTFIVCKLDKEEKKNVRVL